MKVWKGWGEVARIRSVHPSLFTDEAFVSLSCEAQIFLVGLWTEADDQGLFEWKPLTLRMRLRPTKDGDVDGILRELEAGNFIKKYAVGGRHYGAIRNFRKFQRPKFPNSTHPITDDIRNYVCLTRPITEIEPVHEGEIPRKEEIEPVHETPIPRNAEKSLQMESSSSRRSKKDDDDGDDARASCGCKITPEAFELCDELMRLQRLERDDPRCIATSYAVQAWLTKGWKADVIRSTIDIVMSKRSDAPNALRYFEKAIAAAHAEQDRPLPVAVIQEETPHVVRKTAAKNGSVSAISPLIAAADALVARAHERLAEARGEGGFCDGESAPSAGTISPRRGQ